MIKAGVDREIIELRLSEQRLNQFRSEQEFIIELQFKTTDELVKTRNAYLKFVEENNEEITKSDIKRIDQSRLEVKGKTNDPFVDALVAANIELKKQRDERIKELKKMRDESLKIFKEITDALRANIDKRIESRQEEIEESQSEIVRLQALADKGNTDAAESIKAEKANIAKEKLEIEKLQKQKRDLLLVTKGLERVGQLIGQGDSDPFGNAGFELKEFLGGIKSLSAGTDYNIGQTLGAPQKSGTDGHLAWVDKKEKLLSIKNSEKLGGMHQDEVTRRALAYDNDFVSAKAISVREYKTMTDTNIVNKLDSVEKAINNIKIVQQHIDLQTGKEVIIDGNKTIHNDHNPRTFKI